jgi:hypothetical protein
MNPETFSPMKTAIQSARTLCLALSLTVLSAQAATVTNPIGSYPLVSTVGSNDMIPLSVVTVGATNLKNVTLSGVIAGISNLSGANLSANKLSVAGNPVAALLGATAALLYPNSTNPVADSSGYLYWPGGGPLLDTAGNLYASNGTAILSARANLTASNLTAIGTIIVRGNLTASNLNASGTITTTNLTVSGTISGPTISALPGKSDITNTVNALALTNHDTRAIGLASVTITNLAMAGPVTNLNVLGPLIANNNIVSKGAFIGLDTGLTNSSGVPPWHPGQPADGGALTNMITTIYNPDFATLYNPDFGSG